MRYARRGTSEGVPVLFLHGFGGDLDNWLFNLDAVAETAPVIALDLPGHGQSTPRLPGTGLADLAAFVVGFRPARRRRAHLVGHSLGGRSRRASRSTTRRAWRRSPVSPGRIRRRDQRRLHRRFVAAASRRELKPVVEQLFADPSLVSRQLLDDLLKTKQDRRRERGARARSGRPSSAAAGRPSSPGSNGGRGLPLLVVWGREDRIIPAAHAGNAPPGATVAVLEGVGHMAMMEKASEFNKLLQRHVG